MIDKNLGEDFDLPELLLTAVMTGSGGVEEFAIDNFLPWFLPMILSALSTLVMSAAVIPSNPLDFLSVGFPFSRSCCCRSFEDANSLLVEICCDIMARLEAFERV